MAEPSPLNTARSELSRTSTLNAREDALRLAGDAFDALAQGGKSMGMAEFQRVSAILTELSPDFTDSKEAFERTDQNHDLRIDRGEFLEEVTRIVGVVGARQVSSALGRFCLDLAKNIGQQEVEADTSAPDAAVASASVEDEKPLSMLETEGRVLENMVGYFGKLQSSYKEKLGKVEGARARRLKVEADDASAAPPLPRLLGRVPKVAKAGVAQSEKSHEVEEEEASEQEQDDEDDDDADEEGASSEGDEEDDNEEESEAEDEDDEEDAEDGEEDNGDGDEEDEESDEAEEAQVPKAKVGGRIDTTKQDEGAEDAKMPSADVIVRPGSKKKLGGKGKSKRGKADKKQPAAGGKAQEDALQAKISEAPEAPKQPSPVLPEQQLVTAAPGRRPSPTPKSSAKPQKETGKKHAGPAGEAEGVRCVQTLDMGLAVRGAICIKRDVWTVDWSGNVTIRERDNASKVKAEIPTNRFIWCMLDMDPDLIWMGQEAQGISIFDSKQKKFRCVLTGGHSGGVTCLALHDGMWDMEENSDSIPRRRVWSGSNDFTIRQWELDTWHTKGKAPETASGSTVVEVGEWKVAISKGQQMHGHKNGVRALLRLGPVLWSGADDGSIRVWCCSASTCIETIEKAHRDSVLKLSVVKSCVWSAGSDGLIKEWTIGGDKRECLRQVSPPGSEKGVYALVPLGHDVWTCGHYNSIQVLSQQHLTKTTDFEAHEPYISNLLAVDRVETRIVWSTSLGDRKLKVWRHTIRGNEPGIDELRAANRVFAEQEQKRGRRLTDLARSNSLMESELAVSATEYRNQLEALSRELAEARSKGAEDALERGRLEAEVPGFRSLFERAGLGHLLDDPEALKKFLDRAGQLDRLLKEFGFEDPEDLRRALETLKELKKILEDYGFAGVLKDPSELIEVLSRYNGMKQAFDEHGFSELFQDPYALKGFPRNYAKIRKEFEEIGLEYLLDSSPAMRDFLQKHGQGEKELKDSAELTQLKKLRSDFDAEIESMRAELERKERERLEALERERMMALKYKELDIFKLDIIARELKVLDGELGLVGKEVKNLKSVSETLKNFDEQQGIGNISNGMLDQCHQLRAHIRDVINKCFSETQKMHIGFAIDDHLAAGELKEAGVMVGYVCEEIDVPDHGNSKAAKLRQNDEMQRERRERGGGSRLPSPAPRPPSGGVRLPSLSGSDSRAVLK